jgi:hypothetical protein
MLPMHRSFVVRPDLSLASVVMLVCLPVQSRARRKIEVAQFCSDEIICIGFRGSRASDELCSHSPLFVPFQGIGRDRFACCSLKSLRLVAPNGKLVNDIKVDVPFI